MTDEDPKQGRIRLGRRRREAVETLDAIEMAENALEATEETMGPADPAVMLVEEQRRLIKAQVSNERMGFVLRVMTALVGLAFVAGLALMVWSAARSRAVVVDAFDSPYGLTRRGHTGQVIARGVADVVQTIGADARNATGGRAVALTWTRDVAVVVPSTGVSLGEIDKLLRTWFGKETHIGGAVTVSPQGEVSLTIRADGVRGRTFTGTEGQMPRLITEASEYIYGRFEPQLYASYLLQTQRYEDAERFIPEAYALHPGSRAALAYDWGILLATLGRPEEAVEKLRLSLRAEPDDPQAWDMLIATLFDTEGEEAAARAGRQMAARPARDGPPMESSNYLLLIQDWTRVVEIAEADVATTGGEGALGGQQYALADAEGHRHDWAGAGRHIAAAVPGVPMTQAARRMVEVYRALDAGDRPALLAAATSLDALWRADEDVAFTYYEAPCYLGLAEGLAGRTAQAEAAFTRGDRFVACAAFRADVLEARGLRAEADRQYGVAIRLAPSLPFAYQRRGLALLARGDTARAVGRFQDAHERGPRWADPLKAWGDALAAQGRWAEAAVKYAEAEPRAPHWRALHLAHATALERLGRRREAEIQIDKVAS
jgi:tetratricopeptide (TPR) repeat protein